MRPFSSRVAALYLEPPRAAGFLFVEPASRRVLLLLRAPDYYGTGLLWGTPGGMLEAGETPYRGAVRECLEEIGRVPDHSVLEAVINGGYVTYLATVRPNEPDFAVEIDDEHLDAVWADSDWLREYQAQLHPGVPPLLSALSGYFGPRLS